MPEPCNYSQIELRIAAIIAGDAALLEAFATGQDVHALTAASVLGRPSDADARQAAKAVAFGLLYGMGAPRLAQYARQSFGVEMSEGEAEQYKQRFFARYSGLRRWHRRCPEHPVATRTLAGRRRLSVVKFTEQLNTPVQGSGADGLKLALALLYLRRERVPSAAPVLIVHDEIVGEVDAEAAEQAKEWLRSAMVDGMSAVVQGVPIEVELTTGPTWWKGGGEKKQPEGRPAGEVTQQDPPPSLDGLPTCPECSGTHTAEQHDRHRSTFDEIVRAQQVGARS